MRTLLVTGDEDAVAPVALVQRMHGVLPLATMRVLPACGHWASQDFDQRERLASAG